MNRKVLFFIVGILSVAILVFIYLTVLRGIILHKQLINILQQNGYSVELLGVNKDTSLFSQKNVRYSYKVNEDFVYVFLFSSSKEAKIQWEHKPIFTVAHGTPRFFKKDRLIINYLGDDKLVINILNGLFNP